MINANHGLRLRHQLILTRLRTSLGTVKTADLERCADRLSSVLPSQARLANNTLLAMFGGGKDSSFMMVAVRYLQLRMEEQHGETIRIRIATNRHAGMPPAVMQNIDRVYRALDLYDDPTAELLIIDGNVVSTFDPNSTIPAALRDRNRLDILMNGHRCQSDARPTFCNRCNLSMENALAIAIGYGAHADLVITGDSPAEQRYYLAWVRHASRKLGNSPADGVPGLRSFLLDLDRIEQKLSDNVFNGLAEEAAAHRMNVGAVCKEPLFFSIYEDTTYRVGDHWELITGYLGFVFDEIAFSFTESDCGNPGLMAHLNGLRHERVLTSTYAQGVREYASYAISLMHRKEFPEQLIAVVADRYGTDDGIDWMRRKMGCYARDAFDLSEDQLVCMIFSPFTEGATNLRLYLMTEKPELARCESQIRRLLSGEIEPEIAPALDAMLTRLSGLDSNHRRALFRSKLILTRQLATPVDNPLSVILQRDPHKAVIERETATGEVIRELISGR